MADSKLRLSNLMIKESLLLMLTLKQNRASISADVGEEPGMMYWQGYHDAVEAIFKLVKELDDGQSKLT
jgi:hypothetical protein